MNIPLSTLLERLNNVKDVYGEDVKVMCIYDSIEVYTASGEHLTTVEVNI